MDWDKQVPFAVTVCDRAGVVVYMNDKSAATFERDGGRALVGTSLIDCHPEPSRSKLVELLTSGRENIYTIEKEGKRKLICQTPWYEDGVFAGLVELSIPLPKEMAHFVRS